MMTSSSNAANHQHDKQKLKAWFVKDDNSTQQPRKTDDIENVLIKFITKQTEYAVPENPVTVKENANAEELNVVLTSILKNTDPTRSIPLFEFLFDGEILVSTIGELFRTESLSHEKTFEVEYFKREEPPKPKDSLQHDDWVSAVKCEGKILLTGCYDNTVQLWEAKFSEDAYGKKGHLLTIPAHKAPVKAVAWINYSQKRRLFVSSSMDQTSIVWLWNKDTNAIDKLWDCRGHTQSVECVAVEHDNTRFATGSWDTSLKIWEGAPIDDPESTEITEEPPTKKAKKGDKILKSPMMTLIGHSQTISGVDYMSKNNVLSCSWDHSVRLWDLEEGAVASQWDGNVPLHCISHSKKNHAFIVGCADRYIRLYDPRSSGVIVQCKFGGHSQWISGIQWHKTKQNLFVSSSYDQTASIYDRRSPKAPLYCLSGHNDKVLSVDWSDANHIVTGSADCTAKVFTFVQ